MTTQQTCRKIYLAFALSHTLMAADIKTKGLNGRIDIAGGTAHLPILRFVAKKMMQLHPEMTIAVTGGGSGVGLKKLSAGLIDIASTGRPLSLAEKTQYGFQTRILAHDAIVVGVQQRHPLRSLSRNRVQMIFSLKPTTFEASKAMKMHPIQREHSSGTRQMFESYFMTKGSTSMQRDTPVIVTSNAAMVRSILQDSKAIGYFSFGFLRPGLKALAIDGVYPTRTNIQSGKYSLKRELLLHTNASKSNPRVQAFFQFLSRKETREKIEALGFLSVGKSTFN